MLLSLAADKYVLRTAWLPLNVDVGFDTTVCGFQNCKAAVIRIGLEEMRKFIQTRYPEVGDDTFFQSCGVADLITTSCKSTFTLLNAVS
jgi:glycerol-3-phosphate dehydrogenase